MKFKEDVEPNKWYNREKKNYPQPCITIILNLTLWKILLKNLTLTSCPLAKRLPAKFPIQIVLLIRFYQKNPPQGSLFFNPTPVHEIVKFASSLNTSKSCGADEISPKVIKHCIHWFVEPLLLLFFLNKLLYTGIIPDNFLKLAKIITLLKKVIKMIYQIIDPLLLF